VNQNQEAPPPRGWKKLTFNYFEAWFSRKTLRRDRSEWAMVLAVVCYTIIFSYFTIERYMAFHAYAWDFGIFNQSFWTTTHNGGLFVSTVEQFLTNGQTGIFFGTHFSPILFVLVPFYSVFSLPQTLLISQSFILALGAVPLYFFAKNALKNRVIAVVFSIAYLFYPLLQGVNWFDFHVQVFLPLFFFSTIYFLVKEKWLPYFLFIFLSLTVAENVPITVVFIGLYCFWRFRKQVFGALKARKFLDARLIAPVLTIVVALIWIFFAGWIRQTLFPFDPAYTQLYKAVDNWSVLGLKVDPNIGRYDDPIKLPLYLIQGIIPGTYNTYGALTHDFWLKMFYVVLLFGPLLFLSFRSSITAISLAWLVPAIFSNYRPYYMIGDQFPAYPIAFIFLGAVEAVGKGLPQFQLLYRLRSLKLKGPIRIKLSSLKSPPLRFLRWLQGETSKASIPVKSSSLKHYAIVIFSVSLVFTVILSPISPVVPSTVKKDFVFADYTLPVPDDHTRNLMAIAALVPDTASILTTNTIFAHFSGRANAYAYPLDPMIQKYYITALDIGTSDFTLSALIKTTQTTLGEIISKGNGINATYNIYINNGKVEMMIRSADSNHTLKVPSSFAVNDGNWHHIVGTRSANSILLYVDGILNGIRTIDPTANIDLTNAYDLVLGRRNSVDSAYFKGAIDEVRVYNRALDGIEVTALYTGLGEIPRIGLIGEWLFNEGKGTTADDTSSYIPSSNGAINGALWSSGIYGNGNALNFDGTTDFVRVNTEMQKYVEGLFQKSDYVMVDNQTQTNWYGTSIIGSRIQSGGDFGPYALGDLNVTSGTYSIFLFKKDYTDLPKFTFP
jgi:uncharacterized membrane protein